MNRLLLFILLLVIPVLSQATMLKGLYEFQFIVENQGKAERERAISHAFADLLIRITGDQAVAEREAGQSLMQEASRYVRQFRYSHVAMTFFSENGETGGPYEPLQQIEIEFDEESINQALWRHQLPVWGKNRPAVLIWLAVQDAQKRWLVDNNEASELLTQLMTQAERRGLPVVYPLMDLEDQLNISVNEVWGNFSESILAASVRYQPESILVGRMMQSPLAGWHARWSLYSDDEVKSWEAEADGLSPVINSGINQVADELASRYAQVSGANDERQFLLRVSQIKGLQDYVRADRYIRSLAPVADIQVAMLEPSHVTFRLELRGNRQGLEKAIALSAVLAPQPDNDYAERLLSYRLQP